MADEDISWVVRVVRGVLLLTGVAVFALGLLVVFVPGMERLLPVEAMIQALGSDYSVVATVGVAAVGLALFVLLVQSISGVNEAAVPVVESVESAPHPGQALDRSAQGHVAGPQDRLRGTAVQTLMRRKHCSRADARERIDEGTWTDDDVAAAYLGTHRTGVPDKEAVQRTAEAIERLDEESEDDATPERENDHSPSLADERTSTAAPGSRTRDPKRVRTDGDRRRGAGTGGK
jgi:hypothetical protein